MARIYLDRQRPDQAVELLRAAVRSLPDHQRLTIQLAYALDRTGRTEASSEAMLRAEGHRVQSGATSRSRYNAQISTGLRRVALAPATGNTIVSAVQKIGI